MKTLRTLAWLIGLLLASASCGGGGGGGGGSEDGGDGTGLNPVSPGAQYVSQTDPAQQNALIQSMWQTLTDPPCWSGAFITDPGIGGSVGSVAQFQFSGQDEYRFVGTSTFFGSIYLVDVGEYQGRPAALISTWTGTDEGIVVLDGSTFDHAFPNLDNTALVVTRYRAVTDPGGCQ